MPPRRVIAGAVVALVAFAGILLVPRGGDGGTLSKPEYERKVQTVYADVQDAFRKTNVTAAGLLAARVAEAQSELRDAADELDDAKPPGSVASQNDRLVAGMRAYADDLEELRRAAELGDSVGVRRFNASISENPAVRQIAEAAEEMKFEGYDLGPISEE